MNYKIEVYCPDCGKLFCSEEEMLRHYSEKHEEKRNKEAMYGKLQAQRHEFSLSKSEEVLRELDSGWQVVRHGKKFEWSKSLFRFELLRKPILTNKRLILLNGEEIDYELSVEDMKSVEEDTVAGNPYLRIELKNGEAISLAFTCVSPKMLLGELYLSMKSRSILNQWIQSINNLILKRR